MVLQLGVVNVRMTAAATLTVTCERGTSPKALQQALWGIGDVQELHVERRPLDLVDVIVTYENEALAEDARALLLTFVPEPQSPPNTPLTDEIISDEDFQTLTVIRDANERSTLHLECQCPDFSRLLQATTEFGEIKPEWKVEGRKDSLVLTIEYLNPTDCRRAYEYWASKIGADHRPPCLLPIEDSVASNADPIPSSPSPQAQLPEAEEGIDLCRLQILIPEEKNIEEVREEY